MTTLNARILVACLFVAALPTMAAAQVVNERSPGAGCARAGSGCRG